MACEERVIRAVPIWLLREYLVEAGGRETPDGGVAGNGWTATLIQVEDFQIGSLRVGQVRLELEGTEAALAAVRDSLEPRLQRAGG